MHRIRKIQSSRCNHSESNRACIRTLSRGICAGNRGVSGGINGEACEANQNTQQGHATTYRCYYLKQLESQGSRHNSASCLNSNSSTAAQSTTVAQSKKAQRSAERCRNATECPHCSKVHSNHVHKECWNLEINAAKRPVTWTVAGGARST